MIRLGVLGTARVVPYGLLAPAKELQGVAVTGIASRTLKRAEEFATRYGLERGFGSYAALLKSPEIDAVYIALPPALHYEWARRAIEAGKHVLCEKPLAVNAHLARSLTMSAKQHDRVLVEAMHVRYLNRLLRQRELVAGGELGRLLHIESCFRSPYTPMAKDDFRLRFELGGGAALDVGCYAVSCLRFMAGEEPEILSVWHKCRSSQIDRWMRATVGFPSGVDGVVEFGFGGFYMPRAGVVVTCENGRIKWATEGLAVEKGGISRRELVPTKSTYLLQLDAFVKAIRGEKSNVLAAEDAVSTARVLDMMYDKVGLALRGTPETS
jgi:predicted dehydrogenase